MSVIRKPNHWELNKHEARCFHHILYIYFFVFLYSFHRLHDFDNNTKLDGLEIFSAIAHAIPWEPEPEELKAKTKLEIEEEHTLYYTGRNYVLSIFTERGKESAFIFPFFHYKFDSLL